MINYTVIPEPLAHYWHVTLSFDHDADTEAVLELANWVPGSYMVRDLSRHIVEISASCNGVAADLAQVAKNVWHTAPLAGHWQVRYTVYAYDLSVRTSFLTAERGFFDGACLFLALKGRMDEACRLLLEGLPRGWDVATTLPRDGGGAFSAASYYDLIDHPVEAGNVEVLEFEAGGIRHAVALSGRYEDFDRERLCKDLAAICGAQLQMFASAPFREYLFMLYVGDNLYGGLEHGDCCALMAGRDSLPCKGGEGPSDAYIELLGLFSHEYFHAWNVKSIRPAAFSPYRLDSECYTEQLWAFEGITSYYDDWFLLRAGVIGTAQYLGLLARNISSVQQGGGRMRQTLAESSFAAWHKFYRQDENAPNAIVSYYRQGALAALCLDLCIRERSSGLFCLDDVMRGLYEDGRKGGRGLDEGQWQVRCQEITGLDLSDFFADVLYTTRPLPLEGCLAFAGIRLTWGRLGADKGGFAEDAPGTLPVLGDFGARFKQQADHAVITHVANGGSAENAGLCPQDKVVAVNGYACTRLEEDMRRLPPGGRAELHYFRQGVLRQTVLSMQPSEAGTALLSVADGAKCDVWLRCGGDV
ncbi:MAG: PDZ domain-containing protein [Neisseria sp.]|nr:PDZ domain-containing protein [Neisseria sp.]